MRFVVRLTILASVATTLSFAGSWSGFLVDSVCYSSAQKNTKPGTHPGSTDNNRTLRLCVPKATTTSFAVMQQNGESFSLDSEGNGKARELLAKEGKKAPYRVNVTGEMTENTVKVDTISMAQ